MNAVVVAGLARPAQLRVTNSSDWLAWFHIHDFAGLFEGSVGV